MQEHCFKINDVEEGFCYHCYTDKEQAGELCTSGNMPHNIIERDDMYVCTKCTIAFNICETIIKNGIAYEQYALTSYGDYCLVKKDKSDRDPVLTFITGCGLTEDEALINDILE